MVRRSCSCRTRGSSGWRLTCRLRRAPAIIIPGWRNRLFAYAVRLLPRWALRKLAGRVNRLTLAG